MALLFLFCMAVQVNDPDPLRWIALYGLAGLSCGLSYFGRLPRMVPLALGWLSFVWGRADLCSGVRQRTDLGPLDLV